MLWCNGFANISNWVAMLHEHWLNATTRGIILNNKFLIESKMFQNWWSSHSHFELLESFWCN